jgi:archaeosortase B (VPXXXP-CTERM-specific)
MKKRKSINTPKKIKKSKSNKTPIKFFITFALGLLGITVLFSFIKGYWPVLLDKASSFTASAVVLVLNLFGMSARCHAHSVSLDGYGFTVVDQCLGAYEIFIFSAGVIAYPTDYRKKLWGIVLGIPFLYSINIVRLIVLGVVGRWSPQTSEIMHLYLWQIIIFLTVILACVLWIKLIVQPGEKGY